jgi:hypothetical protein
VAGAITAALLFGTIELLSYAFGEWSRRSGNPYFLYRSDFFYRQDLASVAQRRYRPIGWPRHREPRDEPARFDRVCGHAFGDSFVYGDEVGNDETWPHILGEALNCEVRNFAFSAFGLDQAVLRYELEQPKTSLVLLGVIGEMLRRDLAASWVFYAGRDIPPKYGFPEYFYEKPYFVLRGNELVPVPLPPDPVTHRDLERHHQYDFFKLRLWTRFGFPYSFAVGPALYRHFTRDPELFRHDLFWRPEHPSGAGQLALRLIARLSEQVARSGGKLAVVLTPLPAEVREGGVSFDSFLAALRAQSPTVCVINPFAKLREVALSEARPALAMPDGHYSVHGNRAIAAAVKAGLDACGIAP